VQRRPKALTIYRRQFEEQLEADEEEEEEKEGSTSLDVVTRCGDETDDTQHKTDAVWPRSLIRGVELSTMTTIA
jgi:hypothetical protein